MRARNIKPGFYKNDELAGCSITARYLTPGLWCMADREGRLEDRPMKIKIEILPYDNIEIEPILEELVKCGHIIRYELNGIKYIQIVNFTKHQRPHHMEEKSLIPPPPGAVDKYNYDPIGVPQRRRIYDRDKHACLICGSKKNLHLDHIVPVSKGGTSDDDNLRTLCKDCNVSKGNRSDISLKRKEHLKHEMTSSQYHDDKHALHPTDSLIPDSLIPDSSSSPLPPKPEPPPSADPPTTTTEENRIEKIPKSNGYYAVEMHPSFNEVREYITHRLPHLARHNALEVNRWLIGGADPAKDIYPSVDYAISVKGADIGSFSYFSNAVMSCISAKKERDEQAERMRKKYAKSN